MPAVGAGLEEISGQAVTRSLASYIADLENPLLAATRYSYVNDRFFGLYPHVGCPSHCRAYYTQKAGAWIRENSTPAYLALVEQALSTEQSRCRAFLTPHTEKNLMAVLDDVCLQVPLMELLEKEGSGCAALLANDMVDDLKRMFHLLSRLPTGLVPMCEIFSNHIVKLGADRIQLRTAALEELPEKEREKDTNGGAYDPQFVKVLSSS